MPKRGTARQRSPPKWYGAGRWGTARQSGATGTSRSAWGWFRGTPFRSPLQGGLKGLGARGGGGDEGLKVEGGFTFGRLQGGLKGASRGLEGGFKGASPWRGLQGGLKGAWRGLQGGFKGAWSLQRWRGLRGCLKGAWRGLQGGLKGASRGLHLRKASRGLEGGLKGASRGLEAFSAEGGFEDAWRGLSPWRRLQGGLKGASRGLEGGLKPSVLKGASRMLEEGLKGASGGLYIRRLGMCKVCTEAVHSEALWTRVTAEVWDSVGYLTHLWCSYLNPKTGISVFLFELQGGFTVKEAWRGLQGGFTFQWSPHHHHGAVEGSFTRKTRFGHRSSPRAHSISKFFF